ncbi:hypothetical protein DFH09DRAFT_1199794 [Mycena vulgaris]|nr:hypothetical protein DFH09DRAFT_1215757 [Mycena vulgaris]KAJ6507537.1 hypothetical protein DFH09DRAFT_1199794 [Mycena vulgaris]
MVAAPGLFLMPRCWPWTAALRRARCTRRGRSSRSRWGPTLYWFSCATPGHHISSGGRRCPGASTSRPPRA